MDLSKSSNGFHCCFFIRKNSKIEENDYLLTWF